MHLAPPPELPNCADRFIYVAAMSALALLVAGGGLFRKSDWWPYLWHAPLVLWGLIIFLAAF